MNASYNKFGELSGLDSASPGARHKAPYTTGIPEPITSSMRQGSGCAAPGQ